MTQTTTENPLGINSRASVNEINFAKIMKAISKRLHELYPDYKVYSKYPESNFTMPCFVVRTTGGNLQRRIRQDKELRGITNERFTLEFFSLDVYELQKVGYELRLYLDTVETDDGDLYRCLGKNTMMALTENHVSLTFRIRTEPYIEKEPIPKMTNLDLQEDITYKS